MKAMILMILKSEFAKDFETANRQQLYYAISKAIMTEIADSWQTSLAKSAKGKQAYYFSAEFLMGRALGNNLLNLGDTPEITALLADYHIDLKDLENQEADAGLGNGGLGRLAACFLESAATMALPLHGYGIRYQYGLFKQTFNDGFQVEIPDDWLKYPEPWSIRRDDEALTIHFADGDIRAIPYDTPIIGYRNHQINTLRLWQSEAILPFDFDAFNEQAYDLAVAEKNRAEAICKVLYPNDSKDEGKKLRLKQQYFFVSASLQDLVRKFVATGDSWECFPERYAVQLNDTHPVVAVPELIRILMDDYHIRFNRAFKIAQKTFAYTNHTILQEALEKWHISFYKSLLPRVYEIIQKIDRQFMNEFKESDMPAAHIQQMRIIQDHMVHMAYLAIYGSHSVNGVAALHTDILKQIALKDWYELFPERFNNKTNGITQRRWLKFANPELSALITECLGNESWITHLSELKGLEKFADDEVILSRFMAIKQQRKQVLADYIRENEGVALDPKALFDIQIKRLHEYKRQLLNAFQILHQYYELLENPEKEIVPRVYIFGAKAAPGYYRAKGIIKYINEIAKRINDDPVVAGRIKVHFVENYNVSYGELLFPAADLSEQISTAGKEASGTGNMKFMLNGTPTIGTLDGANIEIVEEAGIENNFIFGAKVEELEALNGSYDPVEYYLTNPKLKRIVDTLIDGTFSDGGTGMFHELYSSLMQGASWHRADNYFLLYDFEDYVAAQAKVSESYEDPIGWARKCWLNLANAGKFSSDRTILQYAEDIWQIKSIEV
ncbi:glycogen/starch/alpha-glucan phosphorylase [Fusibacter paucivorans]|uniref:Alpha-1,4 glucan phosphorylase n=1 Tax=Fusibacter paucivorans TaxID=76009 RepID=A0ABS5PTG4_9FIRM|nr:glycogen/starch/alpha-glucan phosphorylase [Fusibacter paucivorans]MBS7528378.1 glycogen/starch/alpha-glucan phosphorylase [Fusibacter paucivorans]